MDRNIISIFNVKVMIFGGDHHKDYIRCSFYGDGHCGSHNNIEGIFSKDQLTSDVKHHLTDLRIMRLYPNNSYKTKGELIERFHLYLCDSVELCAYHRHQFGDGWVKSEYFRLPLRKKRGCCTRNELSVKYAMIFILVLCVNKVLFFIF